MSTNCRIKKKRQFRWSRHFSHTETPLETNKNKDSIIVFVFYGLKQPSKLPQAARMKVSSLAKQLDTDSQAAKFDSGNCPENYLVGNINIYPLALENTSWHNTVDFGSPKEAPILEIRFMGLKGAFRHLLDDMTAKTGDTFLHLDGESIWLVGTT